jgi:hypothetical protein
MEYAWWPGLVSFFIGLHRPAIFAFWSLDCLLLLLCDCWPGVARLLLTFFASPKKVSQKRRPHFAAPSGFPVMQVKKWEVSTTRCAQTRTLLYPFSALHNRQLRSGISKSKTKQNRLLNYCSDLN